MNINKEKTAVLVSIDTGDFDVEVSILELTELAKTAGAKIVSQIIQKKERFDPATCIGSGKLEELKQICDNLEPDIIIFDCELTATQIRNIENFTDVYTIDRTMLILDIFAMRAKTAEGKLQVELAQQRYRLPRLTGLGVQLSRLGAGIGTRGPGESKLETDKRHIRNRISHLKKELEQVEKRRNLMRQRRKKDGIVTVAIVGYTNVGKSTLLNSLTKADVLAENKLFATLETTSRGIRLKNGKEVILVDTVGLIRRLPHHLVEAFKSTLEEASNADVLLHICDASVDDAKEKADVTLQLLKDLGCVGIPIITVFNKCDLNPEIYEFKDDSVKISAKNKKGFDDLLEKIEENLAK